MMENVSQGFISQMAVELKIEILHQFILLLIIYLSHNLTAELSWHVQNCDQDPDSL